jgi:hypothetical protein
MRNPHCEQMFSALLPTTDVIRQRRSSATSITARVVDHPAGGKAPRPQRSPRVVFLNSAFSSRRAKSIIGTPQAGARPMTRPRGLRAAHAPLRRPLPRSTAQEEITNLRAVPGHAKDRCSRKPLADLLHPQHNCRQIARIGDGIGDANWPMRIGLHGLPIAGPSALSKDPSKLPPVSLAVVPPSSLPTPHS